MPDLALKLSVQRIQRGRGAWRIKLSPPFVARSDTSLYSRVEQQLVKVTL